MPGLRSLTPSTTRFSILAAGMSRLLMALYIYLSITWRWSRGTHGNERTQAPLLGN